MSNPTTGITITGILKGYYELKRGQYINRYIGVVTSEYTNRYGETEENIEEISVSPAMSQSIKSQADSLKGNPVRVHVGQACKHGVKDGRPWGFINTYVRKDTVIEDLNKLSSLKKAS